MDALVVTYVGLALLAVPLSMAERRPREGLGLDVAFWLVTPLFTGALTRGFTLGLVAALAAGLGYGVRAPAFLADVTAFWPWSRWLAAASPWLAVPLTLLVADGLGYLSHRVRHRSLLYRFHAVHHAPERLYALTASRLHPVDELVDGAFIGVALLLLGVPLSVFYLVGPIFLLHTLVVHAALPWRFGPLRFVFVSPVQHRRHHARGLATANFAGIFSLYDVLFGTFSDEAAGRVGEGGPAERLGAYLAYPFRRATLRTSAVEGATERDP